MRRLIVGALAPVLVLATLLAGCGSAAPNDLKVGACLGQLPSGDTTVTSVSTADCAKPHAAEVYQVFNWTGSEGNDSYPGDTAVGDKAQTGCSDAFQPYVGTDITASTLDVYWLSPTSDSWKNGDRTYICLATPKDSSKLTGTIKGSKK